MLIDRGHRRWAIASGAALALAIVVYVYYASTTAGGPRGATRIGMWFGVLGTLAMLFAGLLSARKRLMRLRLGRVNWWLKGHLWLGLLCVPLLLFHAGFHWGGLLESVLWWLLAIVVVSGFIGLALQNILPRVMKVELPSETIPEQTAHICRGLQNQADQLVREHGSERAAAATDDELAAFYSDEARPYLSAVYDKRSRLHNAAQAAGLFAEVRRSLPAIDRQFAAALEDLCRQRRQLQLQNRMFYWLHGWLLLHVPASIALAVFVVVHVFTALYY